MMRLSLVLLAVFALFAAACASEDAVGGPDLSEAQRCDTLIAAMAQCQPDLAQEAVCDAQTLALVSSAGLEAAACGEVFQAGKADWFAHRGCDVGQHVCQWIFCCDDYELTWFPSSESDWDIEGVVDALVAGAPADALAVLDAATEWEVYDGVAVTFEQAVQEYPGAAARDMAVEITRMLVAVPYDEFQQWLPAARWGVELKGYLGGEVRVYTRDHEGRPVHQLERMVLGPLGTQLETPLSNNDMTKVEIIRYGHDQATVRWRVMFSNNGSTETDVGLVDFRRWDDTSTLMTFHSAHRLNAPGGIHIANAVVQPLLKKTFLTFLTHYRGLVRHK